MLRNPLESKEHNDLIDMMAQYFASQGFGDIKADVPGMPSPDMISGTKRNHVPDLTTEKNGKRIILEAETSSSVFDDHTSSQWSLFLDAAQTVGGEFHLVVPKGYRGSAEQRSTALGIRIDTIWTPK
jgi:hypothetical protein